jgi:site-specific DNA recombinase
MPRHSKNAPGSRVVLYARVSTEEQAGEEHYSIEAQLNEMREFAEREGWTVIGQFVDEGISGTKRDRPELNALLDTARRRDCDIILTHELSRLSRSVYHTLDIFDLLGKY